MVTLLLSCLQVATFTCNARVVGQRKGCSSRQTWSRLAMGSPPGTVGASEMIRCSTVERKRMWQPSPPLRPLLLPPQWSSD